MKPKLINITKDIIGQEESPIIRHYVKYPHGSSLKLKKENARSWSPSA